ncbi:FecR domain-containing protein, partial [Hyalangium sp.]|uniref:FecR domain-containing protein n=1 Tax=Hyalangium sp. TaxID=2028555 RepID=UPI002D2879DE
MQISEVSGTVEVRRADGTWEVVKAGRVLHPSEAMRTKDGSYAVLIGESAEVRVEPGTEVSLEELTAEVSRFLLASGMATASVRAGKRHTFEVRAAGTDAVARTTEGIFTMSNDGAGTVAVGTREGEVAFLGNGKVVIVRAGQQSVVRPGSAGPSEPVKIPSSLLRKVQWPSARQNKREITVQGQAEPGTRLEIAGESFSPGQDGAFTRTVSLKEGENDVKLKVSSVGGQKEEASQKFNVDTQAPSMKVKVPWGNSGGQDSPGEGQE